MVFFKGLQRKQAQQGLPYSQDCSLRGASTSDCGVTGTKTRLGKVPDALRFLFTGKLLKRVGYQWCQCDQEVAN